MDKRCRELLQEARNNPAGIRFADLQKLCECAGMWLARTRGSHFIYKRKNPSHTFSIQKMPDGKAKPYQVRQLLDFIEEHRLDRED